MRSGMHHRITTRSFRHPDNLCFSRGQPIQYGRVVVLVPLDLSLFILVYDHGLIQTWTLHDHMDCRIVYISIQIGTDLILCCFSFFLSVSHSPSLCLQDTVTGFLLAGVGHRTADSTNFLIVKTDTKLQQVEEAFLNFSQRDDVGIILINQHIANDIRHVLKDYNQTIPTVLEIPSKEHPYDPEPDQVMQRVNMYLGGGN